MYFVWSPQERTKLDPQSTPKSTVQTNRRQKPERRHPLDDRGMKERLLGPLLVKTTGRRCLGARRSAISPLNAATGCDDRLHDDDAAWRCVVTGEGISNANCTTPVMKTSAAWKVLGGWALSAGTSSIVFCMTSIWRRYGGRSEDVAKWLAGVCSWCGWTLCVALPLFSRGPAGWRWGLKDEPGCGVVSGGEEEIVDGKNAK